MSFVFNPLTGNLDIASVETLLGLGAASRELDNLQNVAINTSLISDIDSTDDLGSSSIRWANLFVDSIGDSGQNLIIATNMTLGTNNIFFGNSDDAAIRYAIGSLTFFPSENSQGSLTLDQQANGVAWIIKTIATNANVMQVTDPSTTTGNIIDISTANDLTGGGILNLISNSSSTTTRALVIITNDNTLATGAVPLRLQQDSTDDIFQAFDGNTKVFAIKDGGTIDIDGNLSFIGAQTISTTTGNLTISAAAGDDVLIGDDSTFIFVDGGTNTVSFFATAIGTIALYSNPTFTVSGSSNIRGLFSNFFVQDTTGTDFTGDAIALYGRSRIQSLNTSDWTGTVGLRGVAGENILITPSAGTYTVTGAASFYVMNATVQLNTTLTNQYGIYFEDLTTGGTDYGLFFVGNPSGGSIASASNIDISIIPGGTGKVVIDQNGDAVALSIDAESTTANVIDIVAPTTTSGIIFDVNADALTSGKFIELTSTMAGTLGARTADSFTLSHSREDNAGTTLTDDYDMMSLTKTSIANNASTVFTVTGSVLRIENVVTETSGTLISTTSVLEIVQGVNSIGDGIFINQDGDGVALEIDTEATTQSTIRILTAANTSGSVINITANALTTGKMIDLSSNSSSTGTRSLMRVFNNNSLSTSTTVYEIRQGSTGRALFIDQNANGLSLIIDSQATGADVIDIQAPTTTSGTVIDVQNALSLTTGRIARFRSNSSDTNTRNLIEGTNDNAAATGTTVLTLRQDAVNQVMILDQNATGAGATFIDFQGTAAADALNPISTLTTSGATTHHIQIEINGAKAWVAASTNDPS